MYELITPYRQTDVILDADTWQSIEPVFSLTKAAKDMFKSKSKDSKLIAYKNGIIVKPYNAEQNFIQERVAGQDLEISMTCSSSFTQQYKWAQSIVSEMPGVSYGAEITSQGYKMWTKVISASTDWDDGILTADASLEPSPTSTDDEDIWAGISFDRVAYSQADLTTEDDIYFEINVETAENLEPGPVAIIQFIGPPSNGNYDGYKYALVVNAYGRLTLLCKIGSVWQRVAKCAGDTDPWYKHSIIVINKSSFCDEPNAGPGGYIAISRLNTFSGHVELLNMSAQAAIKTSIKGYPDQSSSGTRSNIYYPVPSSTRRTFTPSVTGKLHLDIRRDVTAQFNFRKSGYPTAPVIVNDDAFVVKQSPRDVGGANDWQLIYVYRKPTSCDVDVQLFNSDDNLELTELSSEEINLYENLYWCKKVYQLSITHTRLYNKITLTANGNDTPKLYKTTVFKNSIVIKNSGLEKTLHKGSYPMSFCTKMGLVGPSRGLDTTKATLSVVDIPNALTLLRTRASMPIRIETTYNAGGTDKCVLFRGYMQKAVRKIKSLMLKKTNTAKEFSEYNLMCNGNWQLLKENFHETISEHLFENDITEETKHLYGNGRKVTEIISTVLSRAGFLSVADGVSADEATQDIADSDIRVFGYGDNPLLVINPLDELIKIIESLARDYLGGFIVWDDNLGLNGKWVYKDVPHAFATDSYDADVPVAVFYTDLPSHLAGKKIDYLPSYANSPVTVNSAVSYVPGSFIIKDTWESWVNPPEANDIIVTGTGKVTEKDSLANYTARLVNLKSYDFDPAVPTADPTHPDYLGRRVPLWFVDRGLCLATGTDEEVTNILGTYCQRIYELVAHGIKKATFQAPLVFITHPDDATRVRPLRYYDLIYIDAVPWLIRSVNPSYTKDNVQMAMYEVEAPRL